MEAFTQKVESCYTEGCPCWESSELAAMKSALAGCDLKDLNKAMASFKKKCTSTFAKCRTLQDQSSQALNLCRQSDSDLRARIDTANKNKDSLTRNLIKIACTNSIAS